MEVHVVLWEFIVSIIKSQQQQVFMVHLNELIFMLIGSCKTSDNFIKIKNLNNLIR